MHETFIAPGIVDGAVAHAQAHKRANDKKMPEATIVHDHRYGEHCNSKCKEYKTEEQN